MVGWGGESRQRQEPQTAAAGGVGEGPGGKAGEAGHRLA